MLVDTAIRFGDITAFSRNLKDSPWAEGFIPEFGKARYAWRHQAGGLKITAHFDNGDIFEYTFTRQNASQPTSTFMVNIISAMYDDVDRHEDFFVGLHQLGKDMMTIRDEIFQMEILPSEGFRNKNLKPLA